MMRSRTFCLTLVAVICLVCLSSSKAYSELYLGGGAGWSNSGDLKGFRESGPSGFLFVINVNLSGTNLKTEDSLAFGGKVGYFFERLPWLGMEMNIYHREPDVKRQDWTISGTGAGGSLLFPSTGNFTTTMDIEATTVGFLLMLRPTPNLVEEYLFGKIEPYIGLGFGLHIVDTDIQIFNGSGALVGGSDRTRFGSSFLLSLGVNFKITDHIKLYGEYLNSKLDVGSNEDNNCLLSCIPDTSFEISDQTIIGGLVYSF